MMTTPRAFTTVLALSVLVLISLSACDPGRVLVIKTSGKPDASVAVYASDQFLPRGSHSTSQDIVIRVPSAEAWQGREIVYYYGIGGWSDSNLMPSFAQHIDSIIIVNHNQEVTALRSQPEILDFLLENRHGFAKSRLTIEAE